MFTIWLRSADSLQFDGFFWKKNSNFTKGEKIRESEFTFLLRSADLTSI